MLVKVKGLASGKINTLTYDPESETVLMDFLREQGFAIASSCYGEGVCRKCVVNEDVLSCQVRMKDCARQLAKEKNEVLVTVSYL